MSDIISQDEINALLGEVEVPQREREQEQMDYDLSPSNDLTQEDMNEILGSESTGTYPCGLSHEKVYQMTGLTPEDVDALWDCLPGGDPLSDEKVVGLETKVISKLAPRNDITQAQIDELLEPDERLSQAEVERLLQSINDPPTRDEVEWEYKNIDGHLRDAKTSVSRVIDSCNVEVQTLKTMADGNPAVQELLGEYYTFINECHTKINHLDDLSSRNDELYKRRLELEGDGA